MFLGFDSLMETALQFGHFHQTPCALIQQNHLLTSNQVVLVLGKERMGSESIDQMPNITCILFLVEMVDS